MTVDVEETLRRIHLEALTASAVRKAVRGTDVPEAVSRAAEEFRFDVGPGLRADAEWLTEQLLENRSR